MSQPETLRDHIAMDGSVLKARTTKELHPVNRFRVMFGLPLFPDEQAEGMPNYQGTTDLVAIGNKPETIKKL